ncbi:MAG: IS110 family transposase [Microthrixaceae bacterium]|nr:IS110 family transposase [Microthrixaceae bacterium]
MLSELVDHVIGVDPDRDRITVAVVDAKTQGELGRAEFPTTPAGYASAIDWADAHSTAGRRAWSVEGADSYGSGLTQALEAAAEWAIEFDQPSTRPTKDGAKSDGLDAVRAAREVLGRRHWSTPRSRGAREGLRALLVAKSGAQLARTAAINELKALVLTAPLVLREELRSLTVIKLTQRCARFRPDRDGDPELFGTKTAMRALAQRIQHLTTQAAELEADMKSLVEAIAPQLLDEVGVGVILASQVIVSWSHPGRCRSEAAFARLAGVAPIEATSGQTQDRHRLNRGGDRQLNRALHQAIGIRAQYDDATKAYIARRIAEGKTRREARRCLKRYFARRLYRLLENPPSST